MAEGVGRVSEWRGLTADERRVLRWLLMRGAEITGTDATRATAYLPQLDWLYVNGRCPCGCPTIDLVLEDASLAVSDVSGAPLADVEGRSPEGSEIGLILRARAGSLAELEAYARDGAVTFSLPTDEQLAAFW